MEPLGNAFISVIQMLIGTIIFCTVTTGIAGVNDMKKVGRVAIKALVYFEIVTSLALVIGLVSVDVLKPGVGINFGSTGLHNTAVHVYAAQAHQGVSMTSFLLNIIPRTSISAFATGNILQVLFVSVLFGFGMASAGERAKPLLNIANSVSIVVFWIINLIMKVAPIAAFGAIAFAVGKFGLGSLFSLGKLIIEFYFTIGLFFVLILFPISMIAGFNLLKLVSYIRAELLLVLGTSSSETVFPQLVEKLERLGCEKSVVGLVLPTAYSFNHDGSCLYWAAATMFLAQATNTHMTWHSQIGLLAILLLTSKGSAGVSGSAIAVLAATLAATNAIPVNSIALLLGIHRVLSAGFVFTNIAGNSVATIVVARWENVLDRGALTSELNSGYVEQLEARGPARNYLSRDAG
jgi:aerobic C4-dicarboxylate transport protein